MGFLTERNSNSDDSPATNPDLKGSNEVRGTYQMQISLTPKEFDFLRRHCERIGLGEAEFTSLALQAELRRLWHIERCKPKPKTSRPPGRPPLEASVRELRRLAKQLGIIFNRLRAVMPPGSPQKIDIVKLEAEWQRMVEASDLAGLTRFYETQPWVER